MHHPSRAQLPGRVLGMLGPDARARHFRVVTDLVPHVGVHSVNPWRAYKACLAVAPPDCTHFLVLQDDALLCRRFLWAAVEAIRHRPTEIVAFFLNDLAFQSACAMKAVVPLCHAWSPLDPNERFCPTVATCYPRLMVDDLRRFDSDMVNPIADDEMVGRWRRERGHAVWCTVPSLVQHDEEAPSVLLGHRDSRPRWASCFIGSHSPALVDWTNGL
jgi:hypothetical protein